MATGLIYHDRFLAHDAGASHPERPDRLRAVTAHLRATGLWDHLEHLDLENAEKAAPDWICKVHSERYMAFVGGAFARGIEVLDQGDTVISENSYEAALLAAGGALKAVDAVMSGKTQNVFCLLRPPGHHARPEAAMGFCLFNHAAVAARYAQQRHGVEKVAVVDWDVHHGNGTQEIFYEDPTVFYISTHQYPFYPGTGSRTERGEGKGKGYTLNLPIRAGSGPEEYSAAFGGEIAPALDRYGPDLIIISAGFDAHRDDPLAQINLTESSFAELTTRLREVAERRSGGRIVSFLEGGYNLKALAASVEAHLTQLLL